MIAIFTCVVIFVFYYYIPKAFCAYIFSLVSVHGETGVAMCKKNNKNSDLSVIINCNEPGSVDRSKA